MIKHTLLLAAAMFPTAVFAADVVKDNNTTALNIGTSWVGGTVPVTATDVALFDSTYATTGVLNTGALVDWAGIRVVSPGGNVIINNTTSGQDVVLRDSGIDMSAATVDMSIQRVRVGADQTWNIASGRNLVIGNSSTPRTGVLALASGTAAATITKSGDGVLQLDTANASLGAISWNITGGTVRAIWNQAAAFGTGTITLGGGGIATGTNFTGSLGNWTWNNAISLTDSTSSFIDNQNIPGGTGGTVRWLKLEGVISGSGALEFRNTSSATMTDANLGFIMTGTNTNTGTVTINSGALVRVGGSAAGSTNNTTGNFGKLAADSASVVNNGSLTFARLDAHTVANAISGSGALRIGTSATFGTATTTQVVTLTGANTYTGATTVNNGTLITGNATALGNGSAAVTVNAGTLQIGNGTANSVTLGSGANLVIAAGATLKFFAIDSAIALQGAGSYTLGDSILDLNGLFNAAGTYHLISGGNAAAGTQGTLTFSNFDNTNFSAAFSGGDLVVTAVPEPATYGLMGAGALAAVAFVRRRRKAV